MRRRAIRCPASAVRRAQRHRVAVHEEWHADGGSRRSAQRGHEALTLRRREVDLGKAVKAANKRTLCMCACNTNACMRLGVAAAASQSRLRRASCVRLATAHSQQRKLDRELDSILHLARREVRDVRCAGVDVHNNFFLNLFFRAPPVCFSRTFFLCLVFFSFASSCFSFFSVWCFFHAPLQPLSRLRNGKLFFLK
jgi:hypothetical protein